MYINPTFSENVALHLVGNTIIISLGDLKPKDATQFFNDLCRMVDEGELHLNVIGGNAPIGEGITLQ